MNEINVRIHSESEMVYYNIRALKTEEKLHKNPKMLDSKFLVDKLLEFYNKFYRRLYFQ